MSNEFVDVTHMSCLQRPSGGVKKLSIQRFGPHAQCDKRYTHKGLINSFVTVRLPIENTLSAFSHNVLLTHFHFYFPHKNVNFHFDPLGYGTFLVSISYH